MKQPRGTLCYDSPGPAAKLSTQKAESCTEMRRLPLSSESSASTSQSLYRLVTLRFSRLPMRATQTAHRPAQAALRARRSTG
jgi:hypothetical protein